ncbi:hypothetical protein OIV83_001638 [Microbotryomycetes sp. JL201]|nr:hypothetical protein OIV83_001638 [Microbotryomycetes sp. JL201]
MSHWWQSPEARSWCVKLRVPTLVLDYNIPLAIAGCAFFWFVQLASHYASRRLFPKHFQSFSRKTRLDWDLHCTGWMHALISAPLALYMILHPSPSLVKDPIFNYATFEASVFAFSGGYFVYDLMISLALVKSQGFAFVVHAAACCFIFFKAFTPFLMGIGSMFLIWEASTVFLHPHWFLDKLNMTGSIIQLVNGVFLLLSFLGARLCYGGYMTYKLWNLLDDDRISPSMRWGFRLANLALNGELMIISVQGRLKTRQKGEAGNGTAGTKDDKKQQ